MVTFTDLPYEIVGDILRSLDSVNCLIPARLTCHHINASYLACTGIGSDILGRQIPSQLMSYSVGLSYKLFERLPPIDYIIKEVRVLGTLPARPRTPLPHRIWFMKIMEHVHKLIHSLVLDFAQDAWTLLSQQDEQLSGDVSLSPAEYIRFCRAFYTFDLFCTMFCFHGAEPNIEQMDEFFDMFRPWENEQLACAHDFLEKRFSKATFEILSQDIEFGHNSVDYLSLGYDNAEKQLWLSCGLRYIHRVINETSDVEKKKLLRSRSAWDNRVEFCNSILMYYDGMLEHSGIAVRATEEQVRLHLQMGQDGDKGQYRAWESARLHDDREWVLDAKNLGLRERAYVFWDFDRIDRYDLLRLYEGVPAGSSHAYDDDDFEAMENSFTERSKIWLKSGPRLWAYRASHERKIWQWNHCGDISQRFGSDSSH